jgi:hypothetical protein
MNLKMTIRAQRLQIVIGIVVMIAVTMMNREMMRIFIPTFLATQFSLALDGDDKPSDSVIQTAAHISALNSAVLGTKGGLVRISQWSLAQFAALRLAPPFPSRHPDSLAFAHIPVSWLQATSARAICASRIGSRLCELDAASATNADLSFSSPRLVMTFGRTELCGFSPFEAPYKSSLAMLAGVSRIKIFTFFSLPSVPAFERTKSPGSLVSEDAFAPLACTCLHRVVSWGKGQSI